jgi:hypothetical protein
MIYKPDSTKGIEVCVDADFAGRWDPGDALNADNVYSCTGYLICCAGYPVFLGRVYCLITGSEGDYSNDKFDERNECYLYSLSSSAQVYFEC